MPGNEIETIKYILKYSNTLILQHIGSIKEIGAPSSIPKQYTLITSAKDIDKFVSSNNSMKKADAYINGRGISIKQKGSTFDFSRLQRSEIKGLCEKLGFKNPQDILDRFDDAVIRYHNGLSKKRDISWKDIFIDEEEFKRLLRYLMMEGSPNHGMSPHPAEFILESGVDKNNLVNSKLMIENNDGLLNLYTFDEYYDRYKNNITFGVRRCWVGQRSKSEHNRAKSIMKKEPNKKWVFFDISGEPEDDKWNEDIPVSDRRTVFFITITKNNG
jgi:hypothetical protein